MTYPIELKEDADDAVSDMSRDPWDDLPEAETCPFHSSGRSGRCNYCEESGE